VAGKDKDDAGYTAYRRDRDQEAALLERFRDPKDPLKILIVTAKLLTGFDAPILQALYLDKPLRDHTLLQAICRTNRPYGGTKTHGLIIDYLGVFDDLAQALTFDENGFQRVVSTIAALWRSGTSCPGPCNNASPTFPVLTAAWVGTRG
jgi:type I restriction enzyme, R subunit